MADAVGNPGVLIGRGRAADVYALDDERVLRRPPDVSGRPDGKH